MWPGRDGSGMDQIVEGKHPCNEPFEAYPNRLIADAIQTDQLRIAGRVDDRPPIEVQKESGFESDALLLLAQIGQRVR